MKTITNSTINSTKIREKTYGELMELCVKVPPQQGFTRDTMKQSLKLSPILLDNTDEFQIEDADFIFIKQRVNEMGWGVSDQGIVDFIDYINSIKE